MSVKKKVKRSFLAKHIAKLSTWSFILITIIFYSGFYPGQTRARKYSSATSTYIYDFKPAKSREYQLLDIGKQEFYNYNRGLGRMEHELQVSVLAPTVFFRDLKQIYLQAVQMQKTPHQVTYGRASQVSLNTITT